MSKKGTAFDSPFGWMGWARGLGLVVASGLITACTCMEDSDGDGLSDCQELELGTHPDVPDSDGDGFPDKEEVENWDRDGGNFLRFHPLVADVPRLYSEQLGGPVIELYATESGSRTVQQGMLTASENEVRSVVSRGRSHVEALEKEHVVNADVGADPSGVKAGLGYQFRRTDTTVVTNYWENSTVEVNRSSVRQYYDEINTTAYEQTGGEIKVVLGLANDGDVSFTLDEMSLTAYMTDPMNPSELLAVGTMQAEGGISFTPPPQGRGVDPSSLDLVPFTFVYRAEGNPGEIARVLENSDRLVLEPATVRLDGEQQDGAVALAEQNIRSRTALVILDFGDQAPTEQHRVAVDVGTGAQATLADLLEVRLGLEVESGPVPFDSVVGAEGLLSVRGVASSARTRSYWMLAHTFTPRDAPLGDAQTTIYHPMTAGFAPDDLAIERGDVVHLLYVTDSDWDGLSDRREQIEGTTPTDDDSDDDGVLDGTEVFGWSTDVNGTPCGERFLVFSDPNDPDTDDDGLTDGEERAACTNPKGDLEVEVGDIVLAEMGRPFLLQAEPSNYSSAANLRYAWMSRDVPMELPARDDVTLDLTGDDAVRTMRFQVTVTDDELNQSATDEVLVIVVEDDDAVFVAPWGDPTAIEAGTPRYPLDTVTRARTLFPDADIYLQSTTSDNPYLEPATIVLGPGVNLYGGFDADWNREDSLATIQIEDPIGIRASGRDRVVLSQVDVAATPSLDEASEGVAIELVGGTSAKLDRVVARGPDATRSTEPVGEPRTCNKPSATSTYSSYGVRVRDMGRIDVVNRSVFAASRGAGGARGLDGVAGRPGANGPGGSSGTGTPGATNGSGHNGHPGGKGGDGRSGVCIDGYRGSPGTRSPYVAGGAGGAAGRGRLALGCERTPGGAGGSVTLMSAPGTPGASAEPATTLSSETTAWYAPDHGRSGCQGDGGAGAGGGGGGAGATGSPGGGGGGGGAGGEGGFGGAGGASAGGSFALALKNVGKLVLRDTDLLAGDGGNGGAGGFGGAGGAGGEGGNGAHGGNRKGGKGGTGGRGGFGGRGGVGAGGPVAALFADDVEEIDLDRADLATGRGGGGSQGGWSFGVFQQNVDQLVVGDTVSFSVGEPGSDAATGSINE